MTAASTIITFAAFLLIVAIYQMTTAVVARLGGVCVKEIGIGFGGKLFQWRMGAVTWRINWVPLGGYTKMLGMEDDDLDAPVPDDCDKDHLGDSSNKHADVDVRDVRHSESADPNSTQAGAFRDASLFTRVTTPLAGPVSSIVIGLLLLWAPIASQQPQLRFDSNRQGMQAAVAASDSASPSTWTGQIELVDSTAGFYLKRLVTFQSLEGWGGYVAAMVTIGRAGQESIWHWCTLLGVLALVLGLINLLPMPMLNGFQIIIALFGQAAKSQRGVKVQAVCLYVGLLVLTVLFCRVAWLDFRWVFAS